MHSSVLILTTVIFIIITLITKVYFKSAYLKEIQAKYLPMTQKSSRIGTRFYRG